MTKQVSKEDKIRINEKLIGKTVRVICGEGWYGDVVGVRDEETLELKRSGFKEIFPVSIFDVRSPV